MKATARLEGQRIQCRQADLGSRPSATSQPHHGSTAGKRAHSGTSVPCAVGSQDLPFRTAVETRAKGITLWAWSTPSSVAAAVYLEFPKY